MQLKELIRIIPDFPTKGIQFKDITPLLLDYKMLCKMLNYFVLGNR